MNGRHIQIEKATNGEIQLMIQQFQGQMIDLITMIKKNG